MKHYALLILTMALVSFALQLRPPTAIAQQNMPKPTHYILPPLEYDYPYQGNLTIERVQTIAELQEVCKFSKWALGCAFTSALDCRIVLVRDEVIRHYGWTPELMIRHEVGHCNGWPGDHPGTRIRTAPAGTGPAKFVPKHGYDDARAK